MALTPEAATTPILATYFVNLSFADDLWCFDDGSLSVHGTLDPDLEALLLGHHGG
jgi:hypothetical protein